MRVRTDLSTLQPEKKSMEINQALLLLNLQVEISSTKSSNSTTASCQARCGDGYVHLTLHAARPPLISFLRIYCSESLSAARPYIVATEFNTILLAVALGQKKPRYEHFLYRLPTQKGSSSLELLPELVPSSVSLDNSNTGILISSRNQYFVAALSYTSSPGQYTLHMYSSETREWTKKPPLFYKKQKHLDYFHANNKVITVGGQAGTMAWVDLWHGILLCDVLSDDSQLCYIDLPSPILPDKKLDGCPRSTRDIAFVNGRINYLELQIKLRPAGSSSRQNYISDGWVAAKWSISPGENTWQDDFSFEASQISVQDQLQEYRLLLELEDKTQPPLIRLHTGHPTLSLKEDHVVYFMAKENYMDEKAWVLAIDMRNNSLQGVAEFTAGRVPGFCYTYTHIRVSVF